MRQLFPYLADQDVIVAFLAGKKKFDSGNSILSVDANALKHVAVNLAWWDQGGSIVGLPSGPTDARALNWMLETLGVPSRIEMEVHGDLGAEKRVRYYYDGVYVEGVPYTLVGPMTVMAWRARNGMNIMGGKARK